MSRVLGTYTLRHPILRETRGPDGSEHEEELKPKGFAVVLKRPRAKDLRVMDRYQGQDVGGAIALIAQISNLDAEEADLLDAEDLEALGNVLDQPVPNGPKTGGTV